MRIRHVPMLTATDMATVYFMGGICPDTGVQWVHCETEPSTAFVDGDRFWCVGDNQIIGGYG